MSEGIRPGFPDTLPVFTCIFPMPDQPNRAGLPDPQPDRIARPEQSNTAPAIAPGGLISRLLAAAAQRWLRSQAERVDKLRVQIGGGDRQFLAGAIQQVSISARGVVYRGLQFSQVDLVATGLRVNLGQALWGKPLQLLAIAPVQGEFVMQQEDINASLQVPQIAVAIAALLVDLLGGAVDAVGLSTEESLDLRDFEAIVKANQITLSAQLRSVSGQTTPLTIRAGLGLHSPHALRLEKPQWLPNPRASRGLPLADLDGHLIDLGPNVALQHLHLSDGQVTCSGQITVLIPSR
ncbi:MAG TPA: DUF2993 domain-containing protein [Chroococcidiopsis sp.]